MGNTENTFQIVQIPVIISSKLRKYSTPPMGIGNKVSYPMTALPPISSTFKPIFLCSSPVETQSNTTNMIVS